MQTKSARSRAFGLFRDRDRRRSRASALGDASLPSSFPADPQRLGLRASCNRSPSLSILTPGARAAWFRMAMTTPGSSMVNGSDTMSPSNGADPPAKRKTEDGAPQPRAKRNRYISIAWCGDLAERNT